MSALPPEDALDSEMDSNFDYMYKVLMVGNSGVGKTAFVTRYCDDSFSPAFISTVGIDFRVKTLLRNDKRIKLQLWDTAGQERYQAITTAYYHGAMGFIVMFDISIEASFQAVRNWTTQIKELSLESALTVLVGNKCDLSQQRAVTTEQAQELADMLGVKYFETSAKDNINVREVVEYLVDIISEKMAEVIEKNPNFVPRGVKPRPPEEVESNASSGCSC